MIYYIDIDNTIAITNDSDYNNSKPIKDRIDAVNTLYNNGHKIVYWTARGANSGKDWSSFTYDQLDSWGCLRHELLMNKPSYDILIDDKAIDPKNIFHD